MNLDDTNDILLSEKLIPMPHSMIKSALLTGCLIALMTLSSPAQSREEKRLYETAQRSFRDGLYDVAEMNARKLLSEFPKTEFFAPTRLLLARALVQQSEGAEAVKILSAEPAVSGSGINPVEVRFTLAEAHALAAQYPEAARLYQQIVEDPKAGAFALQARYGLAWLDYLEGNVESAAEKLMLIGEENRRNETGRKSLLTLAKIRLAEGQPDQAQAILQPLITDNPRSPQEFEALLWRGRIAAARADWLAARGHFEAITGSERAQPQSVVGDAWSGLADVLTAQNLPADAAKAYEQAFLKSQALNRRVDAMKRYASAMAASRQLQAALDKLREFAEKNLDSVIGFEADVVRAEILYSQKMFAESLAECRRILSSPAYAAFDLARVHELAADCLVIEGKIDEALALLQEPLKNTKREDQRARLLFKIADLRLQQSRYKEALEIYRQISKEFPRGDYAEVSLFRQGQTQARAGDTKAAMTAYQSLLTQFPQSSYADAARFETANLHFLGGQFAQAREGYEALIKAFPRSTLVPKAQFAVAECLFREEKFAEAGEAFGKFAQSHAKSPLVDQALYNRCLTLAKSGDEAAALEAFDQFVAQYPKSPFAAAATFWLGNHYYNRQDFARAQTHFESLTRNFPQSELLDEALYWAAKSAAGRQETTRANELYQRVAGMPDSPLRTEARLRQAELQRQANQFENALLIYESVLKESGQTPPLDARLGKGICLYALKRYDEAVKIFEEVRQMNRGNLALHNETTYRIGKCLEKLGRHKEALATYMDIVYAKSLPEGLGMEDAAKLPEFVWFGRAGFDAGRIKEDQQDWKGAIQIYKILEVAGGPNSQEARDRKLKLQTEHFIYEE
ncbi:tetratricopeptide repeat protein [Oscillatoria amoena NRMC-F 0135]|nr:tetratricopeptide repeat protein [Oscillatoria amoena NRMC-F 0135]